MAGSNTSSRTEREIDQGENSASRGGTPMNRETVSYKQEAVASEKTFVNRDASQTRLISGVSVPDGPLITAVY